MEGSRTLALRGKSLSGNHRELVYIGSNMFTHKLHTTCVYIVVDSLNSIRVKHVLELWDRCTVYTHRMRYNRLCMA